MKDTNRQNMQLLLWIFQKLQQSQNKNIKGRCFINSVVGLVFYLLCFKTKNPFLKHNDNFHLSNSVMDRFLKKNFGIIWIFFFTKSLEFKPLNSVKNNKNMLLAYKNIYHNSKLIWECTHCTIIIIIWQIKKMETSTCDGILANSVRILRCLWAEVWLTRVHYFLFWKRV